MNKATETYLLDIIKFINFWESRSKEKKGAETIFEEAMAVSGSSSMRKH
jgi:hypothetical protein